jgi:hypothetical protein
MQGKDLGGILQGHRGDLIMCQHAVAANNEEYFYGFDNISHEFFLFKDIEGEDNELVGGSGERPGTHGHLLEAFEAHNIFDLIPEAHITKIGLDLPCCHG